MSVWFKIDCGFSSADESVNFGTRAFAPGDSCIYEASTLATIRATDKGAIQKIPQVCCEMCKTGIALSIDRTFAFFSRECEKLIWKFNFDSVIKALHVPEDGPYACICLDDLTIVRIDLGTRKQLVFPPECFPTSARKSKFMRFVYLNKNIFSVFSCGIIVEMKNINIEINFGDDDLIKLDGKSPHHLFLEIVQDLGTQVEITAASGLFSPCDMYLCQNEYLCSWSEETKCIQVRSSLSLGKKLKMKKIEVTPDQRYLICLTDDGELFLLSNNTLCFLSALTEDYVRDFVLIDTSVEGPMVERTVLTSVLYLTKKHELCLHDLEAGECKFRLAVSANVSMIGQQLNTEGVMHLESSGDDSVDTIMIKFIEETAPESRLERLLQRGKFEQAKEFATLFGLDQESILKAEVRLLMGTLPLWNRFAEETISANYNRMRSILHDIKDVAFVAEVCIKTVAPDVQKEQQLFNYALQRLNMKTEQIEALHLQPIIEKVRSLHLTLGTYLTVCGDAPTSDEWLNFSSRNPVLLCMQFIAQGQMKEAIVVCRRHQHQIETQVMYDTAVALLQSVHASTPPSVLVEWLSCFAPILLRSHRNALLFLVNFIIDRAKVLELEDARNWPDNADNFVSSCQSVINNLIDSRSYGSAEVLAVQQSRSLPQSPINQLLSFQQHLKALSALRKAHHIHISYDLYYNGLLNEESAKNLLLMLFDAVPEHNIEKLIAEFVPSFNMTLYKDISSTIASYVFDLIVRYLQNPMYSDDLYWEARCIAFINCINVIEDKLTTVGRLVEFANVPWSDTVSQLVETTLLIKHPLVATVEEEKRRIPQKLILKKYGFSSDVDLSDMDTLMGYIYDKNPSQDFPSMLEDAKQLVAYDSSQVLIPYTNLVIHAFEKDGLDDALDLCQRDLMKSEIEEVKESVLRITNFKLKIIGNKDRRDKYYEKVQHLISKLSQFSADSYSFHGSAAHLKAVCSLNEGFQQDFRMNDLYRRGPLKILEKCTETLVTRDLDGDQLVASAADTASLIFEPEDVGSIELADKCLRNGKVDVAAKALRRVCDNNRVFKTHSKRITEFLMSASQYILSNELANSPGKSDVIEVLALTALLNLIHADVLSNINVFLRLCKIFTIHRVKPSWSSLYTDPIESPFFLLSPAISRLLSSLFKSGQDPAESSGNLQEEFTMMCQSLPKDLVSLSRIQELACALARTTPMEPAMLKEIKQSTTIICRNVLMTVFSDPRVPDLRLALSLLQNFQPDQILPWLQYVAKHKRDMKFSKNMSLAVNDFCTLHKAAIENEQELSDASRYFSQLNKVSTWSLRAYRHGIPYKEALADTNEEQMRFLKRLIAVNDIELKVLESYCEDMRLDVQECYALYIKHALLTWEPKYKTFKNSSGKKEIIFEDNVDLLKLKCQSIVSKIHKPEELIKMLLKKDFWDQINTYYYEVFMMILKIATTIASSGKFATYIHALTFLLGYTRIGPVQDEESTEWFTTNPGVCELPEIAQYRLPYRSCPFSITIMKHEISLDTYRQWLEAPTFLYSPSLTKVFLCTLAIQNAKTTEPPQSSNNIWNLHHCKRDLLEKIMQCVNEIPDIETAVMMLYYVVNNVMPPGIDQVEAAQQCYLKADVWRRDVRTEVAASKFSKAEKKYFTVSTQHVLHASGLGKPEYLSLAMEPTRLITELYNDPAIINRNTYNTPNINQAVDRIISLHDLDTVKIILELLTQWLHPEAALQATLSDSISNCSEESDEDNITRACYMLLGNKHSAEIEKYLVGQAFPKNLDDTSKSHGVRLRALRILLAITTQEQLENITARDILTIRRYLQVLDFLHELEKFGLVYTVSGFEAQRKEAVLDTILHYKHTPAVHLALKMCRAYAITDARMISKVLKLMLQLDLIGELEEVLIDIPATQVEIDVMKSCWNAVMIRAILKADRNGGTHDAAEVKKVTNLLFSCPDLNFLDLEPVISFFVKVNDTRVLQFLDYNPDGN